MHKRWKIIGVASLVAVLVFSLSSCVEKESAYSKDPSYSPHMAGTDVGIYTGFEAELESIRQKSMIPGFSAAVIKDQRVVWAEGFGYADLEKKVEATPNTPYPLASLTKPFAAVIIMQLVEEGTLRLDDPISDYGIDFSAQGVIQLQHVLSHTSNGVPGEEFLYNGDRFADLGYLIRNASGRSFRELLYARVLEPLEMTDTAPRPVSMGDDFLDVFDIWLDPDNARVFRRKARPYRLDGEYDLSAGGCPDFFTPSAGLNSTVLDLAKFDIALDRNVLLEPDTKLRMFTPTISNSGSKLPYGVGWFTQAYKNQPIIWHYGWQPSCGSSLIMKVPDQDITFIILANSDNLSRPYRLGSGEVLPIDSTLGLAFYKTFIFEPQVQLKVPRVDWEREEAYLIDQLSAIEDQRLHEILQRELLAYRKLFYSVGQSDQGQKLQSVFENVYADPDLRLDNSVTLFELGSEPWIYLPLPGLPQIVLLLLYFMAVISMLVLWPIDFMVARVRSRRYGTAKIRTGTYGSARAARRNAILIALSHLLVLGLYASVVAGYPDSGELMWSGGSVLVKTLIVFANLSVLLSAFLLVFAIRSWTDKYWNTAWRIHYTLVSLIVLSTVFVWQAMRFLGWG